MHNRVDEGGIGVVLAAVVERSREALLDVHIQSGGVDKANERNVCSGKIGEDEELARVGVNEASTEKHVKSIDKCGMLWYSVIDL